ncbi:MAG: exodeoxyribonuclease V subunit alpha [Bradymonadia bacterium]
MSPKPATLDVLGEAEIFDALDLHFARSLHHIAPKAISEAPDDPVALAAALVSRQTRHGHVCLELPQVAGHTVAIGEADPLPDYAWPDLDTWLAALVASPLVDTSSVATHTHEGGITEIAPLVLDNAHRLYLRRYYDHQERLAETLLARAAHHEPTDDPVLEAGLGRLFPRPEALAPGEQDWQRIAARRTLSRHFCVISGGPGTGKTSTVVKILALLIQRALIHRLPVPRIHLLAPTGKAAARMVDSIKGAKARLDMPPEVIALIPEEAATIHRTLGPLGPTGTRFRHHAGNPLATDVVLVDEASMVDLALMARLVSAVPTGARLILLGDKDQLASVEAGAILGDICTAPEASDAEAGSEAPAESPIARAIVHLQRSWRFGDDSGIGALARAINAGDDQRALEILLDPEHPDVTLRPLDEGFGLGPQLTETVLREFDPALAATDPVSRLAALDRFRILCAYRKGHRGVETVNRQVEQVLMREGRIRMSGRWYDGRPVMITRNDYTQRVFNGDIGVAMPSADHDDALRVWFPGEEAPRPFAPARLPPHETVFAMSVHKSQGSEFDHVVLLLPEIDGPILTRELLYTAVTRARKQVTLFAPPEVIRASIKRGIERASGLRARLWNAS